MTALPDCGLPDVRSRTALSWSTAVWWLALGTMTLNDHVLKTAGILPGWLTGKLSDFAGLIVAPVLLTTMTRARGPIGRAACFAIVVVPFVAIKISVVAAHGVESAVGWLGIPWRLWVDPTDLIALGVLPVAWRIAAITSRRLALGVRTRRTRTRDTLGVVAGAAACLATSAPAPYPFRTAAFLANISDQDLTVDVFRARAPLDCAAINLDPATALATTPFDPVGCWMLRFGDMVPLSRNWSRARRDGIVDGPGGPAPPCDAVIVRIRGQHDALLSWQNIGDEEVNADSIDETYGYDIDPRGMYLEQLRDEIYLAPSPWITAQPIAFAPAEIPICSTTDPSGQDGGVP